ncbi:MAG TPA: hypothetical protein VFW87_01675 [Pirellulales bacterium]|nr:hypothetical protein [Pirellulales bacterium]
MRSLHHDPFDDALDRLLAQARWPEPEPRRVARLQAYWQRLSQRPGRRGTPRFAILALAAGLMLATGAACWRWVMSPAPLGEALPGAAPLLVGAESERDDSRSDTGHAPAQARGHSTTASNDGLTWVRAPNRYEQVVLFSAHAGPQSATEGAESTSLAPVAALPANTNSPTRETQSSPWRDLLRRADAQSISVYLAAVERGDRAALAAATESKQPQLELLFGCLAGPVVERRVAAAVALGRVPQPEVTDQLCQYVLNGVCRQEALVGLLSRQDAAAAKFIEQARADRHLAAVVSAAQWQLDSLNSENRR